MTFNVLDRVPLEPQIIHPVISSIYEVTAPLPDLLENEKAYWQETRGNVDAERVAEIMRRRLRVLAPAVEPVRMYLHEVSESNTGWDPEDPSFTQNSMIKWCSQSILAMSVSRMLREMPGGIERYGEAVRASRRSIVVDVDINDSASSGLHFKSEQLAKFIGLESAPLPGEAVWAESESIFLCARPAKFTRDLTVQHGGEYASKDYTSVVPRLKAEVWRGASQ